MKHSQLSTGARLVALIDPIDKERPDYAGYVVPLDKVSAFIHGVDELAKSLGIVSFDELSFDEFLKAVDKGYEDYENRRSEFKAVRKHDPIKRVLYH